VFKVENVLNISDVNDRPRRHLGWLQMGNCAENGHHVSRQRSYQLRTWSGQTFRPSL